MVKKILDRIKFYSENPCVIKSILQRRYHNLKYNLLNEFDRPPPSTKGETANEYYERIDPKYGVRFYELLLSHCIHYDLGYALPQIDQKFRDKKSRDLMKKLLIVSNEYEQKCQESYKKYLIRNEVLKKY